MHRRALPIANPCRAFVPTAEQMFCPQCRKHVHDVSAMTAPQLRRFLQRNVGAPVCIAYRVRRDGTIVLRPEPRALGLVLVTLGLAACAGYAKETSLPDGLCRNASGYEIDCRPVRMGDVFVVPDAEAPLEPERPARAMVDPLMEDVTMLPPAPIASELEASRSSGELVWGVYEVDPDFGRRVELREARERRQAARRPR